MNPHLQFDLLDLIPQPKSPLLINIGEEDLDGDLISEYPGLMAGVYEYYTGDYEGNGQGLFYIDDAWWEIDFNHCSCYGPLDGGPSKVCTLLEDLYKNAHVYCEDLLKHIKANETLLLDSINNMKNRSV